MRQKILAKYGNLDYAQRYGQETGDGIGVGHSYLRSYGNWEGSECGYSYKQGDGGSILKITKNGSTIFIESVMHKIVTCLGDVGAKTARKYGIALDSSVYVHLRALLSHWASTE